MKHFPVPREIRNRIYEFALQLPHALISEEAAEEGFKKYNKSYPARLTHSYPLERKAGSPFDLSLLLVSKAMYLEAYPVFYKTNVLYFKDTDILYSFLNGIGAARRHAVTHVGFNWVGKSSTAAFRLLKRCGSLKTLRFTLPTSYPVGYDALRNLRGLENVIRLTKSMWNQFYGRNVEQWCTQMDEDITQDEVDNEDDMDMASERRAPSFVDLKASLMRPRTQSQMKRLKAKMEKVVVLGGGKK